jgi:hypothetical protein
MPAAADISLQNIELEGHASGTDLKLEDLKGRVVLIVYWWMNDRNSPPVLAQIQNAYQANKDKGLVVMAFHKDELTPQTAANFFKEKKLDIPSYTKAEIEGVKCGKVPYIVIFDSLGKLVYQGSHGKMGDAFGKALADCLYPLFADHEFKKLTWVVEWAQNGKSLAKILRRLMQFTDDPDEQIAEEVKIAAEILSEYAEKRIEYALDHREKNPQRVLGELQDLVREYAGTPIGKLAKEKYAELRADKEFQKEMLAWKYLQKAKEAEEQIGKADPKAKYFDKKYGRELMIIKKTALILQKACPKTSHAEEAMAIAKKFNLIDAPKDEKAE